jgi:hypothetical protein
VAAVAVVAAAVAVVAADVAAAADVDEISSMRKNK